MSQITENIANPTTFHNSLKDFSGYTNGFSTKLSPVFLQIISDSFVILLISFLQYYFRFESGAISPPSSFNISIIAPIMLVLLGYWLLLFWFSGLYKNWYVRSPFEELFTIFKVTFLGCFLIFFFVFLDSSKAPRMLFLLYFAVFSLTLIIGRFIVRKLQKKLRVKGIVKIPAIIVGSPNKAIGLQEKIIGSPEWGYNTIAVVSTNYNEDAQIELGRFLNNCGIFLIDEVAILPEILDKISPKEVLIAIDSPEHSFLLEIAAHCAERKISVKIVPDLYDFFSGQVRTLHLYGIPLIEVNTQLLKPWEETIKRFIDIAFSALVLVLGLPFWLIIAGIIKLESRGSVFYKQERVGKIGKLFTMYKFRSMVQNAEKSGPRWAAVNDPRVTKFGKFIRKSHLDEIPQFWNVLKGSMSIVGPRPERPVFVEKFSKIIPYYKRRLVVRPGITGWWQIKYTTYVESKEEIESRLKDDFYYIENMSLKLDFEIFVRTIYLVIKGHGQT